MLRTPSGNAGKSWSVMGSSSSKRGPTATEETARLARAAVAAGGAVAGEVPVSPPLRPRGARAHGAGLEPCPRSASSVEPGGRAVLGDGDAIQDAALVAVVVD